MQDLNDLYFFAQVVTHGGFAPAGRALDEPKSKLSRRVTRLEAALGVRLIERSSRRFRVTDVGQAFYERCRRMLAEAELAQAVVSEAQGEPHGILRLSCPTGLLEPPLSEALVAFLARYPRVKLRLIATNRRVDIIEERVDVAIRVRTKLDDDASLVMRPLRKSRRILVGAPRLAKKLRRALSLDALTGLPTLTMGEGVERDRWELLGPGGETHTFVHEPRLGSLDLGFLRDAAIGGLGIALLPDHITHQARAAGQLVHVLPEWYAPEGIVHLVFTGRHGLPPAVRALIEHLARCFAERTDEPARAGESR